MSATMDRLRVVCPDGSAGTTLREWIERCPLPNIADVLSSAGIAMARRGHADLAKALFKTEGRVYELLSGRVLPGRGCHAMSVVAATDAMTPLREAVRHLMAHRFRDPSCGDCAESEAYIAARAVSGGRR